MFNFTNSSTWYEWITPRVPGQPPGRQSGLCIVTARIHVTPLCILTSRDIVSVLVLAAPYFHFVQPDEQSMRANLYYLIGCGTW